MSPALQADSLPSEPPGKPIHYLYSFKLDINEPDFENQNGVLTVILVPLQNKDIFPSYFHTERCGFFLRVTWH